MTLKVTSLSEILIADCIFWILVLSSLDINCMVATCIKWIMHSMIYVTGVYSVEITQMFWLVKCLSLSKTLTTWIFSDNMNVINVKLCMMILLIELYLFILLAVTLTISQGQSNVQF